MKKLEVTYSDSELNSKILNFFVWNNLKILKTVNLFRILNWENYRIVQDKCRWIIKYLIY